MTTKDLSEAVAASWDDKINQIEFQPFVRSVGRIRSVGDGVVAVAGLAEAFIGEVIDNDDGFQGTVLNLRNGIAEVIVLKGNEKAAAGGEVYTTGQSLKVPSGEKLMGRVVNPLGEPLDGLGPIDQEVLRPIERPAYGIIDRQPVSRPLQTGLKAVDSMIPIGRGQRELVIGDRSVGKTALVLDAIINQNKQANGERPVFSFYVAIGQKESKIAKIVAKLKSSGALEKTVVVSASASDPVSWQYLAPYAGCAMAEYFLDRGADALIVYDDLTKHAWAYRELSLVMRRPPGREAYPGDIFYIHSKLLERACQLSDEKGGGSLTALPIIETQSGDVSAYIPTNVISITDGQIYLDRDLFNAGVRPAINVGLSVSRVGGKAQLKLMKQLTVKLRLELAQYRELSAFSQFSADLDLATRQKLDRGEKMTEIFKQEQYRPLKVVEQVALFWAVSNGFFDDVRTVEISPLADDLLTHLTTTQPTLLSRIESVFEKNLPTAIEDELTTVIKNFKETRNYGHAERS